MIILFEPEYRGFEHAEVNAAVISSVSLAFPDEGILFMAEEGHIDIVRKKLEMESTREVDFKVISVPPRVRSETRRIFREHRLYKEMLTMAKNLGADKVICTSVTNTGLFVLKTLENRESNMVFGVVVHGILQKILKKPAWQPLKRLLSFRNALLRPSNADIRYVVLGPSIRDELIKLIPSIGNNVYASNHPYFMDDLPKYLPCKDGIIRFGYFGLVGRGKGADLLYEMARELADEPTEYRPKFMVIGTIIDDMIRNLPQDNLFIPSPDQPLSREDYDRYALEIDYSVHFHRSDAYTLKASGTLIDSFRYGKPIIAMRSQYIDYYFKELGDIGYLCDSYEEMKSVIVDLLKNFDAGRYLAQRANILKGRTIFTPESHADLFNKVMKKNIGADERL